VDDNPKASGLQALQGFFGSSNGFTKGGIAMLANRPVQINNDNASGGCVACHHRLRHAPNRTGWDKGTTAPEAVCHTNRETSSNRPCEACTS
jgi:hypothetical protein